MGLTPARLERAAGTLQKGGGVAVAVGMATPGVRAATIAASGVANLPFRIVFPALVVSDSVFFLLHVAIGYAGGQGLTALLHGRGLSFVPVLLVVLAVLLVLGVAGWLVLPRRAGQAGRVMPSVAEVAGAWEEASCPLCLVLGAMRRSLEL